MWISFKSAIDQGISKFIPIKRFGTKKSLPWIAQEIKRLAQKRDKLFQLQRKTGKSKDRYHLKQVKCLVQSKIISDYDNYLQDLLGLAAQSAEEYPSGFIPKKLYSLIKNARQDSQGISSLFDKKENTLVTENKAKATLLNLQFQSVFSQLSPLRLGQLCIDKIQELFENVPQNLKCNYPLMPEVKIDENRILKLLSNLKVDKAAGPDDIKPIVLKELRNEIAPVIKAIFEKSFETGQLQKRLDNSKSLSSFQKGR